MLALFKISWRSIWRNKWRTAITVSAIGFALSIAVFFISFAEGIYAQLIDDAVRMQAGHITIEHTDYRDAPAVDLAVSNVSEVRERIEKLEGVERTKVMVVGQGVAKSGRGAVGVLLMAVEPSAEVETSPLARKIKEGTYLEDSDAGKIVIGRTLADRLKVKVGKKLVVASNDVHGEMVEELLRVKGIFATGADEIDGYLVQIPLPFAQRLYDLGAEQVTQLGVLLSDPDERERVMAQAGEIVRGSDASVRTWEEVMPDLAAYIKLDGGSNIVFQGILIFLSLFTIFNTILMSVLERTREFAVMLALGTHPHWIRAQILVESALIGILGCTVGLTIGGLLGYYIEVYGYDIANLYGEGMTVSGVAIDSIVYGKVTFELLFWLGFIVFASVIVTSLFTMRRVSQISVAGVLR